MKKVYLDYAATTPTNPQVVEVMLPYFTHSFGNPSSIHSWGRETKAALEEAREKVANLIGTKEANEIIFTSGGTESDNFAIFGVLHSLKKKGGHIITSPIEHHAILETCHFLEKNNLAEITYLPVDKYGIVSPEDVKKAVTSKTILISIMHANNEVGTIEPIEEIGKIAKGNEIYFHTDAVQTAGNIEVNVDKLAVDLLSISSHKLYGPKGVGALYIRKGTRISPFIYGGAQEKNKRAGAENLPAIVGFGKACELAKVEMENRIAHTMHLRDKLIKEIFERIDEVYLNGHPTQRLPNNVNISVKYVEGESMLLNLDLKGIAASTGSACSSASLKPSHVLMAMGLPHEMTHGSLRFTLGTQNTEDDIEYTVEMLVEVVNRLRLMSPLVKK